MMSRSLKPSASALRSQRPSFTRTISNSSTTSCASTTSQETQSSDVVASQSYFAAPCSPSASASSAFDRSNPASPDESSRTYPGRPLAIEIPPSRQRAPLHTPSAPLSARGDHPGAYFPLHEESLRFHRSHPFQAEPKKSANPQANMTQTHPSIFAPSTMTRASQSDGRKASHLDPTPTSMSLGKYHPSNYKNKDSKSPMLTPTQSTHTRQKSEIRQKLQQYQRDMVEQASIAGRMNLVLPTPDNPRLAPLGSPGPVTPMELEEGAGYLVAGVGSKTTTVDANILLEKLINAEQERVRQR